MSERNQELELYKLVTKDVSEFGWVNDEEFLLWLYHHELSDFIKNIIEIFDGCGFDEYGVEVHLREKYIVINLNNMLCNEDIELERIFPKDEYRH